MMWFWSKFGVIFGVNVVGKEFGWCSGWVEQVSDIVNEYNEKEGANDTTLWDATGYW